MEKSPGHFHLGLPPRPFRVNMTDVGGKHPSRRQPHFKANAQPFGRGLLSQYLRDKIVHGFDLTYGPHV
jgi:hypothetical protein